MPQRSTCPINGSLEIFGDKWTLLILRDMIFSGKSRFGAFQASAEGIAPNILSARLELLESSGLISKHPDPAHKRRSTYKLTEKGIALAPVMVELTLWGQENLPGVDAQPGIREQLEEDREGAMRDLTDRLRATHLRA